MRIVIDMQGAQTESRFRGIGRYTLEFARAVARNRGEHEVFLVFNGSLKESLREIQNSFIGLLSKTSFKVWHPPAPIRAFEKGNEQRRLISEKLYKAFIRTLQPDVIHITSLFEGYIDDALTCVTTYDDTITTVTLYDLIPLLNPKQYFDDSPLYRDFYTEKVSQLKAADSLFAISSFSRNEAIHHLNLPEKQVVNVSTGISDLNRVYGTEPPEVFARWLRNLGVERGFVLYSGGSDERKNLVRLVMAYANLPQSVRTQNSLVLAGKMRDEDKQLLLQTAKNANLEKNGLLFTGYVSDDQLSFLYENCCLYVFPSWHEGFGLPPLEAMKHGAPVIASNATSIPEVIGLESALFNPFDIASISAKLLEGLSNEAFREELRTHAALQVEKFTWDRVAIKAAATWTQLLQAKVHDHNASHSDLTQIASNAKQTDFDLLQEIKPVAQHLSKDDLLKVSFSLDLIAIATQSKQLFVDVSELVARDAKTGVQRVTRSILKQLIDNPPAGYLVKPVYATTESFGYLYTSKFNDLDERSDCSNDDTPISYRAGDVFLGLDLQHHTTRVQAPFLHGICDYGVDVRFIVYDLLPIQFPEFWPPEHRVSDVHEDWLSVISGFDGVICISSSVACDFTEWLNNRDTTRRNLLKVDWFHLGGDIDNSMASQGLPSNAQEICLQLKESHTFLMVGTLEPRKGHEQALNAFEILWAGGVQANLVIVGKKGWLTDSLAERIRNHSRLGKSLFWLESISDEFLNSIYAASSCLLAASYGEGFGLPLIEAAHHQIPIIARDIPVFREVAGEHAYYFDSKDPGGLAACVRDWLALFQDNKHPTSKDLPWISWKESAQHLVSVLIEEPRTLIS